MTAAKRSPGPWETRNGSIGWRIESGPVVIGAVSDIRPEAQGNALAFAGADELIVSTQAVLAWWDKFLAASPRDLVLEDAEWGEFYRLRKAVATSTGGDLFPKPAAPAAAHLSRADLALADDLSKVRSVLPLARSS